MTAIDADLADVIAAQHASVRADLEALVRLPSIAFDGFDRAPLERSAEAVARLFRDAGVDNARVERVGAGRPAVIGSRPAPPGRPTVLFYAHHDVQPPGDLSQWDSEPFEPVERGGRLYGRGAADDKAGIMVHVAALRAFGGDPPVGVTLFIEGEEEYSSESLRPLLTRHRDELTPDVIVVADSANWEIGRPALTTSLRGGVTAVVQVRTSDRAVHSGIYGGAAPDALTALCRLMATLHDENGDVAVEGLVCGKAAPVDFPEERFRAEAGLLDTVRLIGSGSIPDRLWTRPSIAVMGMDAPPLFGGPNALTPVATARVAMRLAPGQDAQQAFALLRDHLLAHAPWGAQVTVTPRNLGQPWSAGTADNPVLAAARAAMTAAWDGTPPVDIGIGGSIPVVHVFTEFYPGATILVTGVEDPDSLAHGANESLHLADFSRACLAEALLLRRLAGLPNRS